MITNPITVWDISEKIKIFVARDDDDDVDNVCRLYLLLCFCVFYFCKTSKTISNMPSKILDNLDNLSDYNWAECVHTFFIGGLNCGCNVIREKQNSSSLNVVVCVAVVQVFYPLESYLFSFINDLYMISYFPLT